MGWMGKKGWWGWERKGLKRGVDRINGKERIMGIRKEMAEKGGRWDKWERKDEGDEKGKGWEGRGVNGINGKERVMGMRKERAEKGGRWDKCRRYKDKGSNSR